MTFSNCIVFKPTIKKESLHCQENKEVFSLGLNLLRLYYEYSRSKYNFMILNLYNGS